MKEYKVQLEIFAGPLDLLLYLVRKDEVDIYDIPIANITDQYINYIEMLRSLDIDLAGDFLVMAATLMEIKSAMLLPAVEENQENQQETLDPRTELVRQLLEYKKFKDAAKNLETFANNRSSRHTRPDTIISNLQPEKEPELDMDQVSVWTLLEAFDTLMQQTGRYQSYDHITDDTPIDLYQIDLLHRLQNEGAMTFENIFKDTKNKMAMVGMFLAMLELMRNKLIFAEQNESQDSIYLKALTNQPAEQAVQEAIFATEDQQPASEDENQQNSDQQPNTEPAHENTDNLSRQNLPDQNEKKENNTKKPPIPIQELPPETKKQPLESDKNQHA
jgi:segregation and condensation protein A